MTFDILIAGVSLSTCLCNAKRTEHHMGIGLLTLASSLHTDPRLFQYNGSHIIMEFRYNSYPLSWWIHAVQRAYLA